MIDETFEASRRSGLVLDTIAVERIHPAVVNIVKSLASLDCYVAGGYARWACSKREDSPRPTDVDIIALSDEAFEGAQDVFRKAGVQIYKNTDFSITFCARYAFNCPFPIQLLKNYKYATLENALGHVDFSVCRVALTGPTSAVADRRYMGDEGRGRLSVLYVDTANPVNAVCRMLRYAKKGYDISQLDVLSVLKMVKERDLNVPGIVPDSGLSYVDAAS